MGSGKKTRKAKTLEMGNYSDEEWQISQWRTEAPAGPN